MPRGTSGRIVIEVDPHLKRELYAELARRGTTLKAWFIEAAEGTLATATQPSLFVAEPSADFHQSLPPSVQEKKNDRD